MQWVQNLLNNVCGELDWQLFIYTNKVNGEAFLHIAPLTWLVELMIIPMIDFFEIWIIYPSKKQRRNFSESIMELIIRSMIIDFEIWIIYPSKKHRSNFSEMSINYLNNFI